MTIPHLTLLDLVSSMSHMSDWKITKGPSRSHIENTNPVKKRVRKSGSLDYVMETFDEKWSLIGMIVMCTHMYIRM